MEFTPKSFKPKEIVIEEFPEEKIVQKAIESLNKKKRKKIKDKT